MEKVNGPIDNCFCPQTLFLYGTYREDGTPNFGLFCWFSYCWDSDLHVMACIGGEKLTKDRIGSTGVFSANLVTENLLQIADYFGNKPGYDADKMDLTIKTIPGAVLKVPILAASQWSYELEVEKAFDLEGSQVLICKIQNVMADKLLTDNSKTVESRLSTIKPVVTTVSTYFSVGHRLGTWGDWKSKN